MARLKLVPDPTFTAKVGISVPGRGKVLTEFTFRHRARREIVAWLDNRKDATDIELVLDVAIGWELADEFNAENVAALCDAYASAGSEIVSAYLEEIRGVRAKN